MRRTAALLAALVAFAALVALAGCGGGNERSVTVAAASSLTAALGACAGDIPGTPVALEFGGSDDLAAQIRQGVGVDVFAAANMALPEALAAEGRAQPPVPFATNVLVLVTPLKGGTVHRFEELALAPATRLAVGSPSVPIGSYTRQVIDRLPAVQREVVRGEIRTEEPDVKGIVGKVSTGAADAGIVYRTDFDAAADVLMLAPIPARLQPAVVYGVSIVTPGAGADRMVDDLLHGGCATALRRAGFGPPPPR